MIYTKQGDAGKSSFGGVLLSKADIGFELMGSIDELSSFIGLAKVKLQNEVEAEYTVMLEASQNMLSLIAAGVYNSTGTDLNPLKESLPELEAQINRMQSVCPTAGFIRAGGCEFSAVLDVCRSLARRTERLFCSAIDNPRTGKLIKPEILAYLNRLSDFLFALARYTDFLAVIESSVKDAIKDIDKETDDNTENGALSLGNCRLFSERLEKRANDIGLEVSIAFCDASGNPILAFSMPNAMFVSFDYAIKKAYTAVALKMTTANAQKLIQPGNMFFGLNDERLLIIPGGTPIISAERIIGGLGVSGGTDKQDDELAAYGASLFAPSRI